LSCYECFFDNPKNEYVEIEVGFKNLLGKLKDDVASVKPHIVDMKNAELVDTFKKKLTLLEDEVKRVSGFLEGTEKWINSRTDNYLSEISVVLNFDVSKLFVNENLLQEISSEWSKVKNHLNFQEKVKKEKMVKEKAEKKRLEVERKKLELEKKRLEEEKRNKDVTLEEKKVMKEMGWSLDRMLIVKRDLLEDFRQRDCSNCGHSSCKSLFFREEERGGFGGGRYTGCCGVYFLI